MTTRIYVRASTKDQDAERALDDLRELTQDYHCQRGQLKILPMVMLILAMN